MPHDDDPLGGVVRAWTTEDEDEDPLDLVEVVTEKYGYGELIEELIREARTGSRR